MGIFQAFLAGMEQAEQRKRQQAQDAYVAGEREYQQKRRGALDERQDTAWQDSREDRQYEVGTMRPMQEQGARMGLRGQEANVKEQEFGLQRAPVVAQQQDAAHAVNLAGAKQGQSIAAEGASQRRQMYAFQLQGAEQEGRLNEIYTTLNIDKATAAAEVTKAQQSYAATALEAKKLVGAGREAEAGGLLTQWGEGVFGEKVQAAKDDKGVWHLVNAQGQAERVGTFDDLLDRGATMVHPQVFHEIRAGRQAAQGQVAMTEATARAKDPSKFGQTVQTPMGLQRIDLSTNVAAPVTNAGGEQVQGVVSGSSGQMPKVLQEVEAVYSRLKTQKPGVDKDALWLEAYGQVSQRAGASPEQAVGSFYQTMLKALVKPDITGQIKPDAVQSAQQEAQRLTQQFAQTYYPQALAGGQPAQQSPQQPTQPQPGLQGAPAAGGASSVPEAAAAYLRANPGMRDAFDAKYGAGAAARVLNQ